MQQPPPRPKEKLRRGAQDEESGRQDTEARWRATEEFSQNARRPSGKPGPVIVRRRYRI